MGSASYQCNCKVLSPEHPLFLHTLIFTNVELPEVWLKGFRSWLVYFTLPINLLDILTSFWARLHILIEENNIFSFKSWLVKINFLRILTSQLPYFWIWKNISCHLPQTTCKIQFVNSFPNQKNLKQCVLVSVTREYIAFRKTHMCNYFLIQNDS